MSEQRLHQAVADRISRRIRRGSYQPGDRLPGERELAEEFGVSRVTIREAEIALQAQGIIRIKTGSGAYVTDRAGQPDLPIPAVSALELTEARLLFESEAAALAARSVTDDVIEELEQLVAVIGSDEAASDDAPQKADREFHLTIARASGNAAVLHVIESLWRMRSELAEVRDVHDAVCVGETARERGDEHGAILDALRERDPASARLAMQQHFRRLLASMIDITEANAVEELRTKADASRRRFLSPDTHSNRV